LTPLASRTNMPNSLKTGDRTERSLFDEEVGDERV
jgi:hypothetical protein